MSHQCLSDEWYARMSKAIDESVKRKGLRQTIKDVDDALSSVEQVSIEAYRKNDRDTDA